MRIGVLEAGRVPADMADRYDGFGPMMERLLQGAEPGSSVTVYPVLDGIFPASPQAEDGWLVTGSRHGVYDDLPWMGTLKAFLRRSVAERVPVVGICFGHQILADAMGGRVEKSDRGWGVGVHHYAVARPLSFMAGAPASFAIQAMHQDQVVALPPGAEVIAGSDFCPYGALAYGDVALSFQGHPEFEAAFVGELIASRKTTLIPEAIADAALASLSTATDAPLVGRWIADFFRAARVRSPAMAAAS
ncbi:GMP synthase [Allostella vacuolata]|nr:GMP synthase [Stella vacuolata]